MPAKSRPKPKRPERRANTDALVLNLDSTIYPAPAVLQTCQVLDADMSCKVSRKGTDIHVTLRPLNNHGPADPAARFQHELTHQVLRLRLAKENRKSREMLIHQALSASLPAPPAPAPSEEPVSEEEIDKELDEILKEVDTEGRDFKEDPLGIAVPWEERNAAAPSPGGAPPAEKTDTHKPPAEES